MNPLKQEASREEKCPTCGSYARTQIFCSVRHEERLYKLSHAVQLPECRPCVHPWHKGSATVQTPTTKQQVINAIKAQGYYCCTADFGEHEPTCKNYVGEAAPPATGTQHSAATYWKIRAEKAESALREKEAELATAHAELGRMLEALTQISKQSSSAAARHISNVALRVTPDSTPPQKEK